MLTIHFLMKKILPVVFFILSLNSLYARSFDNELGGDTSEVIKLDKVGYDMRLTNPTETVDDAHRALTLAKKINFIKGIAESYRIMGIGNYYLDHSSEAINNYLTAQTYFSEINDLESLGKVYNNIGNLYTGVDNEKALDFFKKSLKIAQKYNNKHLIASLNLNLGNIYYRKKSFNQALNFYNISHDIFLFLNDSANLVQSTQNIGVIYYNLKQYKKAGTILLDANIRAKQLDLNRAVASIDITLADLYIDQNKFNDAENIIEEGYNSAAIVKSERIQSSFKYAGYVLELKRKNYQRALSYLYDIYKQDSTAHETSTSDQINLIREQVKTQERQRENEILVQRQQFDRVKFISVVVVTFLLLICMALLINNLKRKAKTNEQLTNLNAEVSRQKDNLDRINHHLEEIIDERTKDLQVKNKKLSEYSSYLSHQIRGPISTLKGLMNLEKEGLVDQQECINMMNKCVSEIDDKIMEISDMLHDTRKSRL